MATIVQQHAYIARVASAIQGMSLGGLLPSVLIAQACLESGYGLSLLASQYNNHFGLKVGSGRNYGGWTGRSVTLSTREVADGQSVTVNSRFKAFDSLEQSIIERNGLLSTLSRYKPCLSETTPRGQITAICNGGYATGTRYVESVMKIVDDHNLTQYDQVGSGSGTDTPSITTKIYKMDTRTLSIVIVCAGIALAALGGFNLFM